MMDDLIRRRKALDELMKAPCWVDEEYRTVMEFDTAYDVIRDLPAEDEDKGGAE